MNYQESVEYLDRHIGQGVRPGLERISNLLSAMGDPHQGYPIVHIAGTNGKTSTSRMTTALLVAHGLGTGTYTSPHLERIEERFSVNGRYSTEREFALAITDTAVFADLLVENGHEPNTYFELTTAGAFAFFTEKAVNAAVLEVGLGGRLDATNVVDADVCVVTGIGIDHTEFLGSDLKTIAGEKLGIVGPMSILVTGDLPEEAADAANEKTRELGIQHRIFGRDFGVDTMKQGVRGWTVTIDGAETTYHDLFLPVHGRHQIHNLAVSIASAEALLGKRLDEEALHAALSTLTLPGRMEPIATGPLVLLDGAHNADGIATLTDSLREEYPTTRWQIVLGVMRDKNRELMIEGLKDLAAGFILTAPRSDRATPVDELAKLVAETGVPTLVAASSEDAVDMARAEAGTDSSVLVTGSLYLVGEVRTYLSTNSG